MADEQLYLRSTGCGVLAVQAFGAEITRVEGVLRTEITRVESLLGSGINRVEGVLGAKIDRLSDLVEVLEDGARARLVQVQQILTPQKVIRDSWGCLWVRTEADARYQCPDNATQQEILYEVVSDNGNADISEGRDGSIIIAGTSSIAVVRPTKFAIASAV